MARAWPDRSVAGMSTSAPHVFTFAGAPDYPVQFDVEYPDRPLNRVATLLRPFVAIPILVILGLVAGGSYEWRPDPGTTVAVTGGGMLVLPTVLMIVVRRKYPRWWFDFNRELARFVARVYAYIALLDDRYPSTDETQAVRFEIPYPNVPSTAGCRS
jgi:hypothetical protein